jgi:hypothetical protein
VTLNQLPQRRARYHHRATGDHDDIEDRGVDMHRHALDKSARQKRAGQRDRADRSAKKYYDDSAFNRLQLARSRLLTGFPLQAASAKSS